VSGDDYARLGEDVESHVTWIGNEAFMRLAGVPGSQRCAAIVVDAMAGTLSCSVYARRPQVCRDLTRGESACAAELDAKAGRSLLVLRSVRAAS
jgi:uncharacterized protein